jgi:hypothetical protein
LYECITQEKPTVLPTHVLLYCVKQVPGMDDQGVTHMCSYALGRLFLASGQAHKPKLGCALQALSQGTDASATLSPLWGGLPLAVPLHQLALAVSYYDGALGLVAAAALARAHQQGGLHQSMLV